MADVRIRILSEDQTKKGLDKVKANLAKVTAAVAAVTAAVVVFKKGFEFAKEGAQLQLTERRFDRLAKTIDTTAGVLSRDLQKAMGGIVSETEALQLGTDLLSLGLVKSRDEAVRMARAVGELGMDMNQLVLTLTNQTTMRFDALGVSVDGFKEKVKALENAGHDTNEAFRLAFLEQAEDQIEKVGSITEEAAGQFLKLEARTKDWFDELKKGASTALLPFIKSVNDLFDAQDILDEAYEKGIISASEWRQANVENASSTLELTLDLEELTEAIMAQEAAMQRTAAIPPIDLAGKLGYVELADAIDEASDALDGYTERQWLQKIAQGILDGVNETTIAGWWAQYEAVMANNAALDDMIALLQSGGLQAGLDPSLVMGTAPPESRSGNVSYGGKLYRDAYWSGNQLMRNGQVILNRDGGGFAQGGSFTVPPGYSNDSYPMRVQTGEHVQVTKAGKDPNAGVIEAIQGMGFDYDEFATVLRDTMLQTSD